MKGLKLPNLVFVDEHSTCFTRNCLLHFFGSVYSFSAIRRGVSNQTTLEYCTDECNNVQLFFLVKILSKLNLFLSVNIIECLMFSQFKNLTVILNL
ncbi:hypothetical protein Anas_13012 [Armadillidium nasatum]|uniref:Uncharacterized protein n=1 Tax=Armadillidium nasatum TaxID=96803 RepID=A0A5N5T5A2_9CRUS|nr:hypothetical protein Anas_13012 [Armadillidium nasatum]